MNGINVYIRHELAPSHRALLGSLPFGAFAQIDPVHVVMRWALAHAPHPKSGDMFHCYGNGEDGSLSGQFFVDEETSEAGFEIVLHEEDG